MANEVTLLVLYMLVIRINASHINVFGSSINWQYTEETKRLEVCYRLSAPYTASTCHHQTPLLTPSSRVWRCGYGCQLVDTGVTGGVGTPGCRGYSTQAAWGEEGACFMVYTYDTPFNLSYVSRPIGNKKEEVLLSTTIDPRRRMDKGRPNSSPIPATSFLHSLVLGCYHEIEIPSLDPDGDDVTCWLAEISCQSGRQTWPNITLTQHPCTLRIHADTEHGFTTGGQYSVSLVFEDHPASDTMLGIQYRPNDAPLSSTPLKLQLTTVSVAGTCWSEPRFQSPTVEDGAQLTVMPDHVLTIPLAVYSMEGISEISKSGPEDMTLAPSSSDTAGWMTTTHITWRPHTNHTGTHTVCVQAFDDMGRSSNTRCFFVIVQDEVCSSAPCQHGGTCTEGDDGMRCDCMDTGFYGLHCETALPEQCEDSDDSYCVCNVDGKLTKLPLDTDILEKDDASPYDIISGFVGVVLGLVTALSMATFIQKVCLKKQIKKKIMSRRLFTRQRSVMSTSLIGSSTARSPVTMTALTPRLMTPDLMSTTSGSVDLPVRSWERGEARGTHRW